MKRFDFASFLSKAFIFIFGAIFAAVGLLFFLNYDPSVYDVKTTGEIVEIYEHYGHGSDIEHTVYIDYYAGGKKYEHVELGEYNFTMDVGDEVEFYYNSSDPTQIAGSMKDIAPYVGLAFAVVGFLIIIVTAIKTIRKHSVPEEDI